MKKVFFLSLSLCLSFATIAQVGVSVGAQFINAPEWEKALQDKYNSTSLNEFPTSIYLGLDYWFRLKNKRIEFTPELAFSQYEVTNTFSENDLTYSEIDQLQYFSLFLNANFYLLDFAGDCNCPTFSKDGDLIKKGLFLRIAPGINYLNSNITHEEKLGSNLQTSSSFGMDGVTFSLRAGIGLDIGVSDFFTISPLVMATYNLPYNWVGIDEPRETFNLNLSPNNLSSLEDSPIQLFAGIRLGFRFDEMNKYGYR